MHDILCIDYNLVLRYASGNFQTGLDTPQKLVTQPRIDYMRGTGYSSALVE